MILLFISSMGSQHPLGGSTGPVWKMSRFVLKNKLQVKNQNKQLFIRDQYGHLVVKAPHWRSETKLAS